MDIESFNIEKIAPICNITNEFQVLTIFECVLMYVEDKSQITLFQKLRHYNFQSLSSLIFEPTNLGDKFGQNMVRVIKENGFALKSEQKGSSMKSHLDFLSLKCNFPKSDIVYKDLWQIFNLLNDEMKEKFLSIELLDEVMLMESLFKHYCFLFIDLKIDIQQLLNN